MYGRVRSELIRAKSQNSTSSAWRPSSVSTRTNGAPNHLTAGGISGAGMGGWLGARKRAVACRNFACRSGLVSLRCEVLAPLARARTRSRRAPVPRNKERVLRKLLIGALAGAVVLAVAAVAYAATQTTYSPSYTTNKVGKSAGTHFDTTSIDPDNQDENEQPAKTRKLVIGFPGGTKIDQSVKPYCANLDESANDPCPKKTQIGSGTAEVRLKFPGSAPIPAKVTAYNRKKGLWLYVV